MREEAEEKVPQKETGKQKSTEEELETWERFKQEKL